MKYSLITFLMIILILSLSANTDISVLEETNRISSLIPKLSDNTTFSFQSGVFGTINQNYTYSVFRAGFLKDINPNWSLNYDVSYANFNFNENKAFAGIGVNYHNDKFMFSIYMNKSFDADNALFTKFNQNY